MHIHNFIKCGLKTWVFFSSFSTNWIFYYLLSFLLERSDSNKSDILYTKKEEEDIFFNRKMKIEKKRDKEKKPKWFDFNLKGDWGNKVADKVTPLRVSSRCTRLHFYLSTLFDMMTVLLDDGFRNPLSPSQTSSGNFYDYEASYFVRDFIMRERERDIISERLFCQQSMYKVFHQSKEKEEETPDVRQFFAWNILVKDNRCYGS